MDIEELIRKLINCGMAVRRQLGAGFLEAVYKNAMIIELRKNNIPYQTEKPITIYYDNIPVGEYKADIIVDNRVILELKAVQALATCHEVQLVNYLTATKIDNGLLINFGSEQIEFRRKYRLYCNSIKK